MSLDNIVDSQLALSINLGFFEGIKILVCSVFAGLIIRKIYIKYSLTFGSPQNYGNTLLMVLICVSALIAVVKSSLALSLGLVGALSVIRFRTAVKEPYTLAFILFSVCLGIAIGAEQYLFSLLLLITGSIISISINTSHKNKLLNGLALKSNCDSLSIVGNNSDAVFFAIKSISKVARTFNMKSFSSADNNICALLQIEINNVEELKIIIDKISDQEGIKSISFYNSPS